MMKRMNIYSCVSPYKKNNFRLDYFIILLFLIQKSKKLEEFCSLFTSIVGKAIAMIKEANDKLKKIPAKLQTYTSTLEKYLMVMSLFRESKLYEALTCLFDMNKLRNTTFFSETCRRISRLHEEILGVEAELGQECERRE